MQPLIPDHIVREGPILVADGVTFRRLVAVHPEYVRIGEEERTGKEQTDGDRVAPFTDELEVRELFD